MEPAANGPWFIGGRIKVGDSVFEAVRINVKRECKIDIEETRFEVVHTSTHVWAKRKQAPSGEWYRRRDCGVHGDDYGRGEE